VSGKPGCGKSVLSKFLVSRLRGVGGIGVVLYFFCDDKSLDEKTASAILTGLIDQLLRQIPALFKWILPEFDEDTRQFRRPMGFHRLWSIFYSMIRDTCCGPVHCIIDAMDECLEDSRNEFLQRLPELLQSSTRETFRFKIIVSTRPKIDIHNSLSQFPVVQLSADLLSQDISLIVSSRVSKLRSGELEEDLKKIIERWLLDHANGMFLFVNLILNELESPDTSLNRKNLASILGSLPKDLYGIYDGILQKVKPQRQKETMKLLMWVAHATRPLTLNELRICLAIKPEHTSRASMDDVILHGLRHEVVSLCGELVQVEDMTVHLIHQSAKEYLLSTHEETIQLPRKRDIPAKHGSST
jgi:NACHT domain